MAIMAMGTTYHIHHPFMTAGYTHDVKIHSIQEKEKLVSVDLDKLPDGRVDKT